MAALLNAVVSEMQMYGTGVPVNTGEELAMEVGGM